MSEPVYPEDALDQTDPNPEGEDVDPDLPVAAEQAEEGHAEPEDQDEADFDASELL